MAPAPKASTTPTVAETIAPATVNPVDTRGSFSVEQITQLLAAINPRRVLKDGKGHSHVAQQDIQAHLIRIFGFGSFDIEVLDSTVVFEEPREKDGKPSGRYDVCYRTLVRLTVRNQQGIKVCFYENGSTATAQNQTRGDGHDLAYKSAISLGIKRAAISLGDQYGLSLYNKGQMTALVGRTLVGLEQPGESADVQSHVEQQVSLGNDEVDVPLNADAPNDVAPVTAPTESGERVESQMPTTAGGAPNGWRAQIVAAKTVPDLSRIHADASNNGWATPDLMAALSHRKRQIVAAATADEAPMAMQG